MHNIKFIEDNQKRFEQDFKKRGFDPKILEEVFLLNERRKQFTSFVESKRAEVKKLSQEIGQLKRKGEDASSLMQQVTELKQENEKKTQALEDVQEELNNLLATLPNLLSPEVPIGKTETENQEIFKWGKHPHFSFEAKDHTTLGEDLKMLDFEAAAKITGSRFFVLKNGLAKLERALINFMLDEHSKVGYQETIPPFIVHERSLFGTGQLPKFKEDLFKLEDRDWYLIPTAEVPLTNLKREQLFEKKELPLLYTAYTPCFRSEAGSYGKDTRGLIRLHQFNKVEMVNIVAEEDSEQAHEAMVQRARSILEVLELPYRGVLLCSGDIGFGALKTVDLEVWLPSQKTYREISSISNCGPFQARRAGIRYRDESGKPVFAHTLNGSGLAVGRTLVAIMENYQQHDGSIKVPLKLQPYMGGLEVIEA